MLIGRAIISDTCYGEKEKCEAGVGCIMPKTFEAKVRPAMSVIE